MTAQHSTQPTQTERRSGVADRRGSVDAILFGGLIAMQQDAERAYRAALISKAPNSQHLDGVAEGIAKAMEHLSGVDAVEWRGDAWLKVEDDVRRGVAGVHRARRIADLVRGA